MQRYYPTFELIQETGVLCTINEVENINKLMNAYPHHINIKLKPLHIISLVVEH